MAAAMGVGFTSCDNEDYLVITATEPGEALVFTNTIENEYLISSQTSSNVAERFVWSAADFDVPTPVNYTLEGSVNADFSTIDYTSGTIDATNQAVMVRDLLGMAEAMGLDADPSTNGEDGQPNNTGEIYFRVQAFVGDAGAANSVNQTSDISAMTISMIEETGAGSGITIASWGLVGSAVNNWGAYPDIPMYDDGSGVLVAYAYLNSGAMKFRENNDWGNNLGDDGADGTVEANGADIVIDAAGRYKVTLDTNNNTWSLEAYSWGIVGSAYNDWGNLGPDAPFYYDYTTNTFKAGVKLLDGAMKVRFNNDWGLNYGDSGADGTIEEGGDDIVVTAGFYLVTLDIENGTIAIEETSTYGVVGSGYNDWGNAGPDATLTEIQPGIFYADNITLVDGAIKFRVNEDWGLNYGDNEPDGVLEQDGTDITVTAGTNRIMLDFSDSGNPTYNLYPFE